MTFGPADIAAKIPEEVTALDARARRIETPCGEGTMVWRVWGEGEPVALAHGAGGGWQHWLRNIPELSRHYMVMACDVPGCGDSAFPASHDHEGISAALAKGLKQIVGEKQVRLVGFSFGGVCFAHLAAFHPEVVRQLVLVDTGGLDTPYGGDSIRSIKGLTGDDLIERLTLNLTGMMLKYRESVDDAAIWQLLANGRKMRVDPGMLVVPDRLIKILPQVQCPVDAIWGELDSPHPDPALQEAAIRSVKPDIRFRVVPDAGHWAMYERPEPFNRTLLELLGSDQ
jgi:pimeloyl-ACP methyl ester carboxylesterase